MTCRSLHRGVFIESLGSICTASDVDCQLTVWCSAACASGSRGFHKGRLDFGLMGLSLETQRSALSLGHKRRLSGAKPSLRQRFSSPQRSAVS
jgi:hypothetical protein